MNGYICTYKGKRCEVYADTSYAAAKAAAVIFKRKNTSDINVHLAEKDGVPVVHVPDF